MEKNKKTLNDFGGFDRVSDLQRWRFWPRAEDRKTSKRVVVASGVSWFDARDKAVRILARKGHHDVAPQDLESELLPTKQLHKNGKKE